MEEIRNLYKHLRLKYRKVWMVMHAGKRGTILIYSTFWEIYIVRSTKNYQIMACDECYTWGENYIKEMNNIKKCIYEIEKNLSL